jgi:hypothetical protein
MTLMRNRWHVEHDAGRSREIVARHNPRYTQVTGRRILLRGTAAVERSVTQMALEHKAGEVKCGLHS